MHKHTTICTDQYAQTCIRIQRPAHMDTTSTVKTYTDAHAKINMHRYAQTCKNMHRSICTHMQEHSNASADQQADQRTCTSTQKQAHININRYAENMHRQGLFNISRQAQIKTHRHALTRKDKHSLISPDMHQTRLPLANHFAVLPITVQIRRKSVVEDPSILAFPICNVCQLPRLLARPTSDACWWLLSQCRHQLLRH